MDTTDGKVVKDGDRGNNQTGLSSSSSSSSSSTTAATGRKRKADEISPASICGSRFERVLNHLGDMYGQQIVNILRGRPLHHKSSAPARAHRADAPMTSNSTSSSSSSSSSSCPADNKRPRYADENEAGAAAKGKGAISKKLSMSSSQPAGKIPPGKTLPSPDFLSGAKAKPKPEQYDRSTGSTIARFGSYRDAERATDISHVTISRCIRGRSRTSGGFGWRIPGSGSRAAATVSKKDATSNKPSTSSSQFTDKKPHCGPVGVPVEEQYDLANGTTIARFNNQSYAERATGAPQGSISHCVRGDGKSAGGFGWRSAGAGEASGEANGSHLP